MRSSSILRADVPLGGTFELLSCGTTAWAVTSLCDWDQEGTAKSKAPAVTVMSMRATVFTSCLLVGGRFRLVQIDLGDLAGV
jgi:hypothetical protein